MNKPFWWPGFISPRIAPLFSNRPFHIFLPMVVITGLAFWGCAPKQMSLDEAMQTTMTMRGRSFIPPPRGIDDILSFLDKEKAISRSAGKQLIDKTRTEAPLNASRDQLAKFYCERGQAAFMLGCLAGGCKCNVRSTDVLRPFRPTAENSSRPFHGRSLI